VLRPASRWERLTRGNTLIRARAKVPGKLIKHWVLVELLSGYLLMGDSDHPGAVITPDCRTWELITDKLESSKPIQVMNGPALATMSVGLLPSEILPDWLPDWTLDRFLVRLNAIPSVFDESVK